METEIQEADKSLELRCPGKELDLDSDYEIMRSVSDGDKRQNISPEPIYQGPKSHPRSICLDLSVHSTKPKARIRAPSFFPSREKRTSKIYDKIHESGQNQPRNKDDCDCGKKPTMKKAIKNFVKKFGFNRRGRKHSTKSTSSAQSTSTTTTIQDRDTSSASTKEFRHKNNNLSSSTSSLTTLSKSMTSCSGDNMSHIISRKPKRFRSKSTGDLCQTTSATGTGSVTCDTCSDVYCRCGEDHFQFQRQVQGDQWEFQRQVQGDQHEFQRQVQWDQCQFQRLGSQCACHCQPNREECHCHQQIGFMDWDSYQTK